MNLRVIVSTLLLLSLAPAADAQVRWRPGMILDGMANGVRSVAREISDPHTTTVPTEAGEEDPYSTGLDTATNPAWVGDQPNSHGSVPIRSFGTKPHPKKARAPRAVAIDDVIKMVHRGLSDATIIQHVRVNGVERNLNVSDLLRMHDAGVSEPILTAMQQAPVRPVAASSGRVPNRPSANHRFTDTPAPRVDTETFGPSILDRPKTRVIRGRSTNTP